MPISTSFLAAAIPMLSYLLLIWKMDKYDREPMQFVLLHFLWGAIGAIMLSIIGTIVFGGITSVAFGDFNPDSIYHTIFTAPFVEEIAKGIFLIFTVNSIKFDNITDGLVYGGAIGLGFGMTENFMYFISYGDTLSAWIFLVILRSGFSAVMHCISTAILGAFLGMAKFSLSPFKKILPIFGLIVAIVIHFLWNLSVSFDETYLFGIIFMLLLIITFLVFFKYSIKKEAEIIENELSEESLLNHFPAQHIKIISSDLRFRKGWVDESIRKHYFRTVIGLAFNKMQSRNTSGLQKQYYDYEINRKRELIKEYLSGINI